MARFVGNPKDRFCRDEAHIIWLSLREIFGVSDQVRPKPACSATKTS